MGGLSIWHWALVLAVAILLFGGAKMSSIMGDFARGLKIFRHEIKDESTHDA